MHVRDLGVLAELLADLRQHLLFVFDALLAGGLPRQVLLDIAVDQVLNGWRLPALALLAGRIVALSISRAELLRPLARRGDGPAREGADRVPALPPVYSVVEEEGLASPGINSHAESGHLRVVVPIGHRASLGQFDVADEVVCRACPVSWSVYPWRASRVFLRQRFVSVASMPKRAVKLSRRSVYVNEKPLFPRVNLASGKIRQCQRLTSVPTLGLQNRVPRFNSGRGLQPSLAQRAKVARRSFRRRRAEQATASYGSASQPRQNQGKPTGISAALRLSKPARLCYTRCAHGSCCSPVAQR